MPNPGCAGDSISKDPAMQQYFDTLPAFVQETIKLCSIQPQSKAELQQCAEHLMNKNG